MQEKRSRKGLVVLVVLIVLITNFITYTFLTTFGLSIGDKNLVAVDDSYSAQKVQKLMYLYNMVEEMYVDGVDKDALWEGAYAGLFDAAGDDYTRYMTPEEFSEYAEGVTGEFSGIGIRMVMADDERVTVLSVFRNSPAEGVGLMAGDKILSVDGEDMIGMTTDEVANRVRGDKGTTVMLLMERDGEPFEVSIVRDDIVAESVSGQLMENDMGYIQIAEFNSNTASEFNEVLDSLLERGADGLIIDLRNNTGGIVSQVIGIASRIMGSGVIMYEEDNQGNRREQTARGGAGLDMPIVVLANEYSASASEILIGALQDHELAMIVGKKTYGKGIIQTFGRNLDGSGYSITTAKYYTPNGTSIHEQGIEPDVAVDLPEEIEYVYTTIPRNLDTQLDEAIVQLRALM